MFGDIVMVTLPCCVAHTVTLTVDDLEVGPNSDSVIVLVRDTTPPILSGVPTPTVAEQTSPTGAQVSVPLPTVSDACKCVPGTFTWHLYL
ncbi:MAG: hypothetical protein MUP13_09585 [Thermoanaerobaculales bacterium]|nr:hypothetical protein [Thermoanaerobaculales bacterium]